MKKFLSFLLLLAFIVGPSFAEGWIDVTSYINNPYYDNNSNSGWTIDANAGSRVCNYECQEFWNGTWNIFQSITIPNGHYRLTVNAFHRPGNYSYSMMQNWESEAVTSMLYANDNSTSLKHACSESLSENYGYNCYGYSSTWYPNTMYAASYCFGKNMYVNTLEFDVSDKTLTFGIRNDNGAESNWTILDNWKLEFYGDMVYISQLTLDQSSISLYEGESYATTVTIAPDNATLPTLSWESSDATVATVDDNGLITAQSAGTTTITVRAKDGSEKKASCKVTVLENSEALHQVIITEIQNANIDQFIDPSWNYGGWIELYNPQENGISLKGCWLSDDPNDLKKAHITQDAFIQGKSYFNLWFDHNSIYAPSQIDMKLDVNGGTIYLSDKEGNLLLAQSYPEGVSRCSYARKSLTSNEWGVTTTPSPEKANNGSTYGNTRLEEPQIDTDSQIFSGTLTVTVKIPSGTTLRYTTDGSTPTASNGKTSSKGIFTPTSTTTYRFCLIEDGYLPSKVVTRTYIYKDKDFTLPVFSIVTQKDNLYGDDYGILTQGNGNGRPGNGQSSPCNWNMDWERPVNFEYINEEGAMSVNQETAMERCGGWSRAWLPYSFKIKANKQYELQNYLPYDFFTEKPYLRHKTLQIRNGGNDNSCRFKDPALQEIVLRSGINVDCQAYQPAMHYINGKYAGVINIREPNNKHFVYTNYGLDDDEIDQFEMSPDSGYVQKCGTYESMQRWYNLAATCSDDASYKQIKEMVDIDAFCNYMAIEFYLGNWDWPQNNVKAFKPVMDGGKFRFVLFDLDGSFSTSAPFNAFAGKKTYTFDELKAKGVEDFQTGDHITKEIELVTIFLNMLQNENFRKQFIDSYCLVTGSVFEPTRCTEIITELANRVNDAQQIYSPVYGNGASPWSTANTLISELSASRQTNMVNVLKNYVKMVLGNKTAQSVQLSANISEARLTVNDLPVPTNKFNGQLFAPITFKAQAPAGYKFTGWKLLSGSTSENNLFTQGSNWSFYASGSLDGSDWTATSYTASQWSSGNAPLGYGKDGLSTTVTKNLTTYYFRKNITLDSKPGDDDIFTLSYTADDGFIIYINGEEAGRYNMPSGSVGYSDVATTYAHSNPDSGELTLSASLFKKGDNLIAVELHNNDKTSSDIYWDASLAQRTTESGNNIVCTEEEYTMPTSGDMVLQACYQAMSDEEKLEEHLTLCPVVINEVSAANSINVNEYFKKDDWVELYNTTSEDIDLEGMYLTDKSKNPKKYQITAQNTRANTIIPAHGYKIIWCSKRETDSELHANFKLENEDGGMVRLQAEDGSWADSLFYCAHNGDQSVGRYPDGGNNIYLMTTPTIKASNQLSTYATAWEYTIPEDTTHTEDYIRTTRCGGLSIAANDNIIYVKNEYRTPVNLWVCTTSGASVMRVTLSMTNGREEVNLNTLPSGIYIAQVTDAEGNRCAIKIIKP